MKSEQSLTIAVTCIDGRATTFEQPDHEAALKLIGQLAPGRVFSNPFINIAGSRSLTVFPSASIARLDLSTDLALDWEFHMGIHDAYEVSPDEFERLANTESSNAAPSDTLITILTAIEMVNVGPVHVLMVLNARQEPLIHTDFGILMHRFLSAPSFHARRLGGGGIIVNPRHIIRIEFHPCPPAPPKSAWNAEQIS